MLRIQRNIRQNYDRGVRRGRLPEFALYRRLIRRRLPLSILGLRAADLTGWASDNRGVHSSTVNNARHGSRAFFQGADQDAVNPGTSSLRATSKQKKTSSPGQPLF